MADPITQILTWLWNWTLAFVNFLLPGLQYVAFVADILVILELIVVYEVFRVVLSRLSNYAYGRVDALILLAGSTSDEATNIAKKLKSHIPFLTPRRVFQFLTGWKYTRFAIVTVDPNRRKLKTMFRQFQYRLRLGDSVHVGGKLNDAILDENTGLGVRNRLVSRMGAEKLILVAGIGGAHGSSSMLSNWLKSAYDGLGVNQSLFVVTSDTKNRDLAEKKLNIQRFKEAFEKRPRGSTPMEICDAIFLYEYDNEKEAEIVRDELSELVAAVALHGTMEYGSVRTDNLKNVSLNLKSSVAYAQYIGQVSSSAAQARERLESQAKLTDELIEKQATSGDANQVHLPPEAIGPDFSETIGGYVVTDPADSNSDERMNQIKNGASKLANNKGLTWLVFETARRQAPQVWQVYPLEANRLKSTQLGQGLSPKALERMCRPRERAETSQEQVVKT